MYVLLFHHTPPVFQQSALKLLGKSRWEELIYPNLVEDLFNHVGVSITVPKGLNPREYLKDHPNCLWNAISKGQIMCTGSDFFELVDSLVIVKLV